MEKTRSNLKNYSMVLLLFAALSLVHMIMSLLGGLSIDPSTLPEGVSMTLARVGVIVVMAVSLLMLLPRIYIGIKGMANAKNPTTAKGYITWAKVMFVLMILVTVNSIFGIIGGKTDLLLEVLALIEGAVEAIVLFYIIKLGNQVRQAAA